MLNKLSTPRMLLFRHNTLVEAYKKGNYKLLSIINDLEKEYARIAEKPMFEHKDFIDIIEKEKFKTNK